MKKPLISVTKNQWYSLVLSICFIFFSACAELLEEDATVNTSGRDNRIDVSSIMPESGAPGTGSGFDQNRRGSPDMGFDNRGIPSGMGPDFGKMEMMRSKLFGGVFQTPGVNPADPTAGRNQRPKASLDRARVLYKSAKYENAVEETENFVNENQEHDMVPDALLVAGKSYFFLKKYQKAISKFKKIEQNYGRFPKVPEAVYLSAKSYYALGKKKLSRKLLRKYKRDYPDYQLPKDVR